MKFTLKRARRLIGLISSLISLIIGVMAPCATVISSAGKELLAVDSLPGDSAAQGLVNTPSKAAPIGGSFDKLSLRFEQNVGQFDKRVRFCCQGKGYHLALTANEVVVEFEKAEERKRNVCEEVVGDCERLKLPHPAFCLAPSSGTESLFGNPQQSESKNSGGLQPTARILSPQSSLQAERSDKNVTTSQGRSATRASSVWRATAPVKMQFMGANASARLTGLDTLPTKSNSLPGNDPKKWRTGAANFASVKYTRIYRGIDAIFYGRQQNLEYDFIVAPGADFRVLPLSLGDRKGVHQCY